MIPGKHLAPQFSGSYYISQDSQQDVGTTVFENSAKIFGDKAE